MTKYFAACKLESKHIAPSSGSWRFLSNMDKSSYSSFPSWGSFCWSSSAKDFSSDFSFSCFDCSSFSSPSPSAFTSTSFSSSWILSLLSFGSCSFSFCAFWYASSAALLIFFPVPFGLLFFSFRDDPCILSSWPKFSMTKQTNCNKRRCLGQTTRTLPVMHPHDLWLGWYMI